MVGTDKSTELWWPPSKQYFFIPHYNPSGCYGVVNAPTCQQEVTIIRSFSETVFYLEEWVNFDGGLSRGTERPLCTFACRPQSSDCALVAGDVLLVLPLKLVHEVRHHSVVKVLSAQVRVAGGRFDLVRKMQSWSLNWQAITKRGQWLFKNEKSSI